MADLRTKTLGYLRGGLVRVAHARSERGHLHQPPTEVIAFVDSTRGDRQYVVDLRDHEWVCTCGNHGCPHAAAVQLVTGHPTAARKEPK
jgi:hypothetical protein